MVTPNLNRAHTARRKFWAFFFYIWLDLEFHINHRLVGRGVGPEPPLGRGEWSGGPPLHMRRPGHQNLAGGLEVSDLILSLMMSCDNGRTCPGYNCLKCMFNPMSEGIQLSEHVLREAGTPQPAAVPNRAPRPLSLQGKEERKNKKKQRAHNTSNKLRHII